MLLSRNGVGCIAAAIFPFEAIRNEIREEIQNYIEIFVDCPVEVGTERDVKGMSKKDLAGEIQNFTGVSDPYETPVHPDLHIQTALEPPESSLAGILNYLVEHKFLPQELRSR